MKTQNLPSCWLAVFLVFWGSCPFQTSAMSVLDSKHNLSASGPGTVKASDERDICIFCHTPHRATNEKPLWNHTTSSAKYIPYKSDTLKANVDQPNGASKLCLSCHDGTVALGKINSSSTEILMQDGAAPITLMPPGTSNLGTDLSHDHPISFVYNASLASEKTDLRDPKLLTDKVKLDHTGQMQCTSCHNPHDDQYGKFLVMANTGSALCATCHTNTLWTSSAHNISNAPLTPLVVSALAAQSTAANAGRGASSKASASRTTKTAAPKTVGANACNNCHISHGAGARKQLLRHSREEQTCFTCHNGTVVRQNLVTEFNKISVHPVLQTSNLHTAGEDLVNGQRHAACADCHNSHVAKKSPANAQHASGAIQGVKGVNRSGTVVKAVTREYELCFRCHSDSAARKQATVNRITPETNTRQAFNPSNLSFHPVVAIGKNTNVPSLLAPYTTGMTIQCIDCHNNDQGPGAGGTGPSGPHGSVFAPLLERRLVTADRVGEDAANYALCYKCHSRESILGDQSFSAPTNSGGRGHKFHIVDEKTACTTCHDSHGVANNKHLINFNPDYVTAASNGRIEYKSTGINRGNCTLTCHGHNHLGSAYPDSLGASPSMMIQRRR